MATIKIGRGCFLFLALALCLMTQAVSAKTPGEEFTSLFGFTLDRQIPLGRIAAAMGFAPLAETGDAGDYEASLCYKSKSGFVKFLSGETGGPDHNLYGFTISKDQPGDDCPLLPPKFRARDLNLGGIHLGMTRDAFLKIVGNDVKGNPLSMIAVFEYKRPMTAEERKRLLSSSEDDQPKNDQAYFDGDISVEGNFTDDGILYSARVWKIETY